ncbi:glycosyltransferase family 2 protein [Butyrivibrio sp. M55]|uniref:glycosyltransferase family 2 protein n=1 Tax=Butyrivibrio sp. M55 TaxID=1855323 RepID=UPI0008E146BB|nr:glycosyltransferase family 2 protein [Butyrivibrio sp. M55]SFU72883.1 dolichol-phosphate mannosyltransferase [Butyrivibrio sp. M55]
MDISVVIPVYGCREAVPELYKRLVATLENAGKSFEIIMVDDHCPQKSWEEIEKLCAKDKRVVGIKLSRNFGQMRAITAGLEKSTGDLVSVMDCDLQDRPEFLPLFLDKIEEGYDIVYSKRKERKDTFIVKALSRSFYAVYNKLSDMKYDFEVGNYSVAKRKVVDSFLKMKEQTRDYIMFLMWLGYNDTTIELESDERFAGKSSYTFSKKVNLAISLITAQSNKPLFMAVKLGFALSCAAFIFLIYLVIRNYAVRDLDIGWPSVIASIYMMGGLMLSALGIVGIYIGNIFSESKGRPIYIIDEMLNRHEEE